ncbi:FtsX-like permease family protein [Streptomyces sp. CA-111067]|uniref:FtsX-like permease family protein n=1 Tax=Streptomyces sp. CA-111067 TaxID=3240046 RepID=UPI003D98E512
MTGFVLLRVRAHRLLLTAALLTVLLTTCVLATFTAYTGAIGDAALRRTLQHQSADRATYQVSASLGQQGRTSLDSAVRHVLRGAFGSRPATVDSSTRSGPYGLPFALRPSYAAKSTDPDLTLMATFDRSRVDLTAGHWPAAASGGTGAGGTGAGGKGAGGDPVQVAVPASAAQALKVAPGRQITLANRLGGPPLKVLVTGVYRPRDRTAPYWQLDSLGGRGVHTLAFTTYGPMLVDDGTFASGRIAPYEESWLATGDFGKATTGGIGALQDSLARTTATLKSTAATSAAQPSTQLPQLLDGLKRSLLVARSTLLIGALQLIILAGFSLLLITQLLAEERSGETALLRARGSSRARVARLAAGEALLLALPAVLVAPLLSGPVTRLLAGTGAMARTGVSLGGGDLAAAWLVAGATALACAFAVIVPALRSSTGYTALRSRPLPGALQAGADVGLLVIAGVAYWQLERRSQGSGALSAGKSGGLGVDPILVAAPALCLLAGTVLVLRLLPLVARLGERRAARGRGLALALAGWQLSRRPRRGASAVLLLVLAVAMGMFAIGQGASWDRSQRDQADFAVGADIRVTGMTTPPFGQAGIFTGIPGLAAAAPAAREDLPLTGQQHATLLAIDTARAADTMHFRSDLRSDRPVDSLLKPLRAGAPAGPPPGITMPGDTRQVAFTATLTARPDKAGDGASPPDPDTADHLAATVTDANGVVYDFALGDLPPDGAPHTLVLDLASSLGPSGGSAAGPLRLIRLDSTYTLPTRQEVRQLTLASARVTSGSGAVAPLGAPAATAGWQATASYDDSDLSALPGAVGPTTSAPRAGGSALLAATYKTGSTPDTGFNVQRPTATFQMQVDTPKPPVLSAVATHSYLHATGAKVGATVRVQVGGIEVPVRITAAVSAIPGTGEAADVAGGGPPPAAGDIDAGALLLDLPAVNRMLDYEQGQPMQPGEWWLAAKPGASARVAAALRDRTDVETMAVRDEDAAELRGDPVGAGPQSALPAAVIAAAVLAAVGFAVSSVGAIRERAVELAVLRALGAPRRKIARMIAAEQVLLVVVSLAVGVVLGALLTRLVTPLIVLTARAARPVPSLTVQLPAGRLAELVAMILAAPLLVVAATALRRGDPASALRRQGED